jgi:hypothetical protein
MADTADGMARRSIVYPLHTAPSTPDGLKPAALKKGEKEENMVLHFKPRDLELMTVPGIFDQNDEGKLTLHSFALITDDPNPEVAAAGHDRTPVIMREKHMDLWLNTKNVPLGNCEVVFTDKQPTYFNHQIAA